MRNTIVVKAVGGIVCKHCKKRINGKAKLVGLALVCPYCERPGEEMMKKEVSAIK